MTSFPAGTVFLNVYDIVPHNEVLFDFGIGVHHTAVEVYGFEIAFGRGLQGSGLFYCTPKRCPQHIFKEQLVLGVTPFTVEVVEGFVEALREASCGREEPPLAIPLRDGERTDTLPPVLSSSIEVESTAGARSSLYIELSAPQRWRANRYHLLRNNCNHFAEYFAKKLLPAAWLLQLARSATQHPQREGLSLEIGTVVRDVEATMTYKDGNTEERPLLMSTLSALEAVSSFDPPSIASGVITVRRLVPQWVNRLSDWGVWLLPTHIVEKLNELDKNA